MADLLACMTVDLEPDFLSEDSHEVLLDAERFDRFADVLLQHGVPLSVFVAAKMLDQGLPVRERFAPLAAEFELHSYSHDPAHPDSLTEIRKSKAAYRRYFGHDPRGYRAPLGFISASGIRALAAEDFQFSASIFPSHRREMGFDFASLPLEPWMWHAAGQDLLLEIPFAVTRRPRVVICESYLKLLGLGAFKMLHRWGGFPDTLVIDSHLYDFFATAPVLALSRSDYRRHALLRNQRKALVLLDRFLSFLRKNGYRFVTVGEAHEHCRADAARLPRIGIEALEGVEYKVPAREARTVSGAAPMSADDGGHA
jgi:peptidoglycan/xylan/chitin deacetylase (PgdA/CDA1 family)